MSTKRIIYQAQIEKILDLTPSVRELMIKMIEPSVFQFKAGQFAMLHVPQAQSEKPILRAYSIASDERKTDGFRLLFKFVPKGAASTFVWNLKGDETLQFTGPFGRVFFQDPVSQPTEQIVFMCTGTGLAQHLCYLSSKADQFPNLQYQLFFGLANEDEIFCQKDLERYKKQLKNFSYEIVLSRPSSNWQGKTGYVQHHLASVDYKNKLTSFYLCGNGKMIQETKSLLIERDQVAPTRIFSEAFD